MVRIQKGSSPTVYYWVEPVKIRIKTFDLFTAVSPSGLIMSGLADEKERLPELEALVSRYLPDHTIVRQKKPNVTVIKELQEYFNEQRQSFTFPLQQLGTPFQLQVWQALLNIPYGETCSYSDIAVQIGCTQGQRAVGLANNKNPLAIVVPCHRVIGKKGSLVGYAYGLEMKSMLLNLEGVNI